MKKLDEILRKIKKKIQIYFANGIYIKNIDEVDVVPTLKCNLNCVMCHQAEIKCKKNMSLDNFKKIILKLQKSGVKKISIVGGEVFILREVWDMISFLEEIKMKYDLATNAVLLNEEDLKKMKALKYLEKISTSIDGELEVHNKIRRSKIAYDKTINNVKRLIQIGIRVNVACVVQKENFKKLEDIFENLYKMGVNDISFLYELRVTDDEKKITKKIIDEITKKSSEIFISSTKNSLGELSKEDCSLITTKFEKIKKRAKKLGILVGMSIQLSDKKVLGDEYNPNKYACSIFNGYNFQVYTRGELTFCPFISLGEEFNLIDKGVFETLNSNEYILLRKYFKKNGVMPVCRRCCALKKSK